MSRRIKPPKYSLHKPSGQARVRIDGVDHYLGEHGSPESHRDYANLIDDWMAKQDGPNLRLTVGQLSLRFNQHAQKHYVKNGRPTSEVTLLRDALKRLNRIAHKLPVDELAPRHVKQARETMIADGLWGAYSSGEYGILDPQSITIYPPPTPVLPLTNLVRGSWWISYVFDQALWVDPDDPTRSWGVFGNAGISDGEPNPIGWFVILGIGGSSPVSSRKLDTFGMAYYYLGLSDSFRNDIGAIVPVRDEHGLELFYNFGVTPWFHLATDMQVITPILEAADTSLVLGLRAKIDF
jgi:hypothetical protein